MPTDELCAEADILFMAADTRLGCKIAGFHFTGPKPWAGGIMGYMTRAAGPGLKDGNFLSVFSLRSGDVEIVIRRYDRLFIIMARHAQG